ncbi:MAG: hypothetical protein ACSHXG_15560 [Maribacter stanieri]
MMTPLSMMTPHYLITKSRFKKHTTEKSPTKLNPAQLVSVPSLWSMTTHSRYEAVQTAYLKAKHERK